MISHHRLQGSQYAFALAAACFSVVPQQAVAAQVQAYAIFEVAPSANVNAAVEKLRGTSLSNCLQLVIGAQARDVILNFRWEGRSTDTSYLNQVRVAFERVDGISRETIVWVKQGTS